MKLSIRHVRTLIGEIPTQGKLAYCLLRDDRIPAAPKVALMGALGLIVSPLDLPAWIPVVGELDMLALGLLSVKVFVEACPEDLVLEHRRLIGDGESRWDEDRRAGVGMVRHGLVRAVETWRSRTAG